MKFDLHIHTRRYSPDAVTNPYELVHAALAAGLDGIVITEHDWLWPERELEELRAAAPQLVILAGVEVTGRGGDVLCYGVTNPFALPPHRRCGKSGRAPGPRHLRSSRRFVTAIRKSAGRPSTR